MIPYISDKKEIVTTKTRSPEEKRFSDEKKIDGVTIGE